MKRMHWLESGSMFSTSKLFSISHSGWCLSQTTRGLLWRAFSVTLLLLLYCTWWSRTSFPNIVPWWAHYLQSKSHDVSLTSRQLICLIRPIIFIRIKVISIYFYTSGSIIRCISYPALLLEFHMSEPLDKRSAQYWWRWDSMQWPFALPCKVALLYWILNGPPILACPMLQKRKGRSRRGWCFQRTLGIFN